VQFITFAEVHEEKNMRKISILLILILLLAGLYFFLPGKENGSASIKVEDRAFMLDDVSNISFITIKNPGYPLVHLEKISEESWLLNKKYDADLYVVKNMLAVLKNMKIRYIPPATMVPKIMGELGEVGIEIKAYDKDGGIISDFIMASNDSKEVSSFCVQRAARQPYAMHVDAADGGLRNYFNMPLRDLRDKAVFDYRDQKIDALSITYPKDRKNSFKITRNASAYKFEAVDKLMSFQSGVNLKTVDSYMQDYTRLVSEAIRTGEINADSITSRLAFAEMEIKSGDTDKKWKFYPMIDLLVDSINTRSVIDSRKVERYFVFDESGECYIVQHRMVGKYFRPVEYFMN